MRGQWIDPRLAKTTFGEWEPTYTASRVHLAPSTRATAESLMRNHVLPYFGQRPLGSVTPTDVQAFVSQLQSAGLAASTVRQCYLLTAGVLSSAVESDLIARSPCRGIHLPKADHKEMRFLDGGEVVALVEAINPRYSPLVATAAYTGARFGELAALRASRLDLLRGTHSRSSSNSQKSTATSSSGPRRRRRPGVRSHSPGCSVTCSLSTSPNTLRSTATYSPHPKAPCSAGTTSANASSSPRCVPQWVSRCDPTIFATPMSPCSSPKVSTQRSSKPGSGILRSRLPSTATATSLKASTRSQHPALTRRWLRIARSVKFRYPDDTLAPVPTRHFPAGLGGGVDPVRFASGVGECSVGFDRVVFHCMDSEQFAACEISTVSPTTLTSTCSRRWAFPTR